MADLDEDTHPPVDFQQNLRTYHGVLIGLRYVVLAHIVAGSFLVLTFCTPAGWLGGAVVALIELGVGLALAKDRKAHTWMSDAATLFISTSDESGAPHMPA